MRSQQSTVEIQCRQQAKPKIRVVKTAKGAGQSFDLAVAAMTIESRGVTPPCGKPLRGNKKSHYSQALPPACLLYAYPISQHMTRSHMCFA